MLLLLASYTFYGLWNWRCLPLLFATSLVAYGAGIYFKKHNDEGNLIIGKTTRWWISCVSIVFCLGILGYFKYANFFLQSINDIVGGGKI